MTRASATEVLVLRCELGWEEVREVMAASRLLTVMRRSWLAAGVMFAALLATSLALLRLVVTRPTAYGTHRGLLLDELIAGAGLCVLLTCWSALRAWRLSPGPQARHALLDGVWLRGTYEYKLRHDGVAWRAPDGSATFVPWPTLAGACETGRLFLLLDQEGRNVRGFIPKTGRGELPPDADLSSLIRERISSGIT